MPCPRVAGRGMDLNPELLSAIDRLCVGLVVQCMFQCRVHNLNDLFSAPNDTAPHTPHTKLFGWLSVVLESMSITTPSPKGCNGICLKSKCIDTSARCLPPAQLLKSDHVDNILLTLAELRHTQVPASEWFALRNEFGRRLGCPMLSALLRPATSIGADVRECALPWLI